LPLLAPEELDETEGARGTGPLRHARRHLAERAIVTAGRMENRDRRARLDPELLCQWLPGVPCRHWRPCDPCRPCRPCRLYRPLYITRQIRPAASSVIYSDPSGPCATPTGRCCGPVPFSCQNPSANVWYVPAGLPSLNGTNTTR